MAHNYGRVLWDRPAMQPFGRLLTEPFCTSSDYCTLLLKAVLASHRNRGEIDISVDLLKNLRIRLSRQKDFPAIHLSSLSKLLQMTSSFRHFDELFLMVITIAVRSGQLQEIKDYFHDGLNRLDPDNLAVLDEVCSSHHLHLETCIDLGKLQNLKCFLVGMQKVFSARFDDDFGVSWLFMETIVNRICAEALNSEVFEACCSCLVTLIRLDRSDMMVDLFMNLTEKLFATKFSIPNIPFPGFVPLLESVIQASDEATQNWVLSSLASSIRRLVPPKPLEPDQMVSEEQTQAFINAVELFQHLKPFNHSILKQSMKHFTKSFIKISGISKQESICKAMISVAFEDDQKGLVSEILVDVLQHCEGTSSVAADLAIYDSELAWILAKLDRALHLNMDMLPIVHQVTNGVLNGRRDHRTSTRYQVASFLMSLLTRLSDNIAFIGFLDAQLYPLINSLLHCRFQDNTTMLPFDFQCFLLEYQSMIFDLVATASWAIVQAGLKSWGHFLAVFSPTVPWIAYGRKPEHRWLSLEIFARWNRLSKGDFSRGHKEVLLLALIHVLLDTKEPTKEQRQYISEVAHGDPIVYVVDQLRGSVVKGALQFVPACIEQTALADWPDYVERLVEHLSHLLQLRLDDRVPISGIFELILQKEMAFRSQQQGMFGPSDPLLLAKILCQCPSTPTGLHLSAAFQISSGLSWISSELNFYHLLSLVSRNTGMATLVLHAVMENTELFTEISPRLTRLLAECLLSCPDHNPLFHPTKPLPDTSRPLYGLCIYIWITARRTLNYAVWFQWLFGDAHPMYQAVERRLNDGSMKAWKVDFAFVSMVTPSMALERIRREFFGQEAPLRWSLCKIQL